jgi:hypothetical protein
MVLAYDQTLECAELAQTEAKNNINGRWVLISPAPYSAPAVLFPTVSRMQSFEILKVEARFNTVPTPPEVLSTWFLQIPRRFQAVLLPA